MFCTRKVVEIILLDYLNTSLTINYGNCAFHIKFSRVEDTETQLDRMCSVEWNAKR